MAAWSRRPGSQSVNGTSRAESFHNGAEVFASLRPEMNEAIKKGVQEQLNSIFKSAFPEAGVLPGN